MPTKSLASRTHKRRRRAAVTGPVRLAEHARRSDTAIAVGRISMGATVAAWLVYLVLTVFAPYRAGANVSVEAISFGIVVTFLAFSILMYLLARQSTLRRGRRERPARELDSHFAVNEGAMTVLLPSHAEDPGAVHAALWAAALRDGPSTRVVLVLDDAPPPGDPAVAAQRDAAHRIADALVEPRTHFADEVLICEVGLAESDTVPLEAVRELAQNYRWAAGWLADRADEEHEELADSSAVEEVLGTLRHDLDYVAAGLEEAADRGDIPAPERMLALQRRLLLTFSAACETIEREGLGSVAPAEAEHTGVRVKIDTVA